MERKFSWARTFGVWGVLTALLLGGGYATNQLTGTNAVDGELSTLTKRGALESAKKAAVPAHAWRERAKEVKPQNHPVQKGWSAADMHRVSLVVEKERGLKPLKSRGEMLIASGPLTNDQISTMGTSYYFGTQKQRCAVWLNDVVHNNVGQPVSAKISSLRCVPVS